MQSAPAAAHRCRTPRRTASNPIRPGAPEPEPLHRGTITRTPSHRQLPWASAHRTKRATLHEFRPHEPRAPRLRYGPSVFARHRTVRLSRHRHHGGPARPRARHPGRGSGCRGDCKRRRFGYHGGAQRPRPRGRRSRVRPSSRRRRFIAHDRSDRDQLRGSGRHGHGVRDRRHGDDPRRWRWRCYRLHAHPDRHQRVDGHDRRGR